MRFNFGFKIFTVRKTRDTSKKSERYEILIIDIDRSRVRSKSKFIKD